MMSLYYIFLLCLPLISCGKAPYALLFPGTLWCGSGHRAQHRDQLGIYALTDACCRRHDLCPFKLNPLQEGFGITNRHFHAALHCECDDQFRACLKRAAAVSSSGARVGRAFFDMSNPPCFEFVAGETVSVCLRREEPKWSFMKLFGARGKCLEEDTLPKARWRKQKGF